MKWSHSHVYTLKEAPNDAEIPSHILMVRAGLIKKIAPGIYTYGHFALRAIRKFESIVREELDKQGCVEVLMPVVQPKELWEESNRWTEMGDGLQKLTNRNNHEFCLGATHEEVVTDYVRKDIKSYRNLPVILYQVQTKFRDEIRPRFGLMRCREFIMKDAYSFDESKEMALESYKKMYTAYENIFKRLELNFQIVHADSGNIGGNLSQEFHVLAASGEDHLMVSEEGDYAANAEVCPAEDLNHPAEKDKPLDREKFETKGLRTIKDLSKFLKLPENQLVKTLFFAGVDDPDMTQPVSELNPITVLLRGSDEVNTVKLKNLLGLANPPEMLSDKLVKELTGAQPGSCGPVGLKGTIYVDKALSYLANWIVGANEDDFHLRNVNPDRDFKVTEYIDARMAREGDKSPHGEGQLKSYRGIEVGHIFYLGTKYSDKMAATFLNKEGKANPLEMGCYGIGITRTVQAAIEQSHDKDGIIWPLSIAPFAVHICCLDPQEAKVMGEADRIYKELIEVGVECFMDDREERPGVKFKDADLLGLPLRITVGGRGLAQNEIELVERKTKEKTLLPPNQVVSHIQGYVKGSKHLFV